MGLEAVDLVVVASVVAGEEDEGGEEDQEGEEDPAVGVPRSGEIMRYLQYYCVGG